jgi:hypothetical protein
MTGTAGRMGVGAGSITAAHGDLHHGFRVIPEDERRKGLWKQRPVYSWRSLHPFQSNDVSLHLLIYIFNKKPP